jgi:hypothetical protein
VELDAECVVPVLHLHAIEDLVGNSNLSASCRGRWPSLSKGRWQVHLPVMRVDSVRHPVSVPQIWHFDSKWVDPGSDKVLHWNWWLVSSSSTSTCLVNRNHLAVRVDLVMVTCRVEVECGHTDSGNEVLRSILHNVLHEAFLNLVPFEVLE